MDTALQINSECPEAFEHHPLPLFGATLGRSDQSDPEKPNTVFKLLKVNTIFKEEDHDNLDTVSSGIDSTFSALILPDGGIDSPAANDSSIDTPEFERRSSKASRSKSLVSDMNGNLFHKKSRFCTVKEAQDHNTSIQEHDAEDQIVPQSGDSLENSSEALYRKSRTDVKKFNREGSPGLKKESRLLKAGQNLVDCLKEMKSMMIQKKLKMKIYDLIQKKGKVMLNQQPYHKGKYFGLNPGLIENRDGFPERRNI